MNDGPALSGQFAHQGQRDDALPRTRPTRDHHRCLGVLPAGARDRVPNVLESVALLVEENEHLPALNLVRRERHELLRRRDLAAQQRVRGTGAALGREVGLEEVAELPAALPGEHPPEAVLGLPQQVPHAEVGGVVEVGHPGHVIGGLGEDRGEVLQVLAVPTDLLQWVGDRAPVPGDRHQDVAVFEALRGGPLLQLDHEVSRTPRPRRRAGQDDVGALARQRQLVLDQHLDATQAGAVEVGGERRKAPLPRATLAGGGTVTGDYGHLLSEPVGQVGLEGREAPRGLAKQRRQGWAPVQHDMACGGACPEWEARRSALTRSTLGENGARVAEARTVSASESAEPRSPRIPISGAAPAAVRMSASTTALFVAAGEEPIRLRPEPASSRLRGVVGDVPPRSFVRRLKRASNSLVSRSRIASVSSTPSSVRSLPSAIW